MWEASTSHVFCELHAAVLASYGLRSDRELFSSEDTLIKPISPGGLDDLDSLAHHGRPASAQSKPVPPLRLQPPGSAHDGTRVARYPQAVSVSDSHGPVEGQYWVFSPG